MVQRQVWLWVVGLLLLAGCSNAKPEKFDCPTPPPPVTITLTKKVKVEVPVPVYRTPPPELMNEYKPDGIPEFVPPSDPRATSALTGDEGEKPLLRIVQDLINRDKAWRAWATKHPDQ